MIERLEDVRADIAARLTEAVRDRRSPMHVPTIVTSDVDARVMVLRGFDKEGWRLRFHTDMRAPKVRAIAADPRMAVLLYDKPAKIQLRLRGKGQVLCDHPLADQAWQDSTNFARRCYLGDGPGTASEVSTSGLPARFEGAEPSDDELVPARANFAVIDLRITHADWFHLAHTGHVRAQFTRDGDAWEGRWCSP
ncbi:pyridoxamine 5'-phosphate oxidase family protein [Qipengyuania nanhaisediminis]|uniref:pyridoxamine 5'-phosphate oxidase family protein n=1 Tax=Qipengyuania nanhaisediminis TaxID=604088 RepID=UPI0038B3D30A